MWRVLEAELEWDGSAARTFGSFNFRISSEPSTLTPSIDCKRQSLRRRTSRRFCRKIRVRNELAPNGFGLTKHLTKHVYRSGRKPKHRGYNTGVAKWQLLGNLQVPHQSRCRASRTRRLHCPQSRLPRQTSRLQGSPGSASILKRSLTPLSRPPRRVRLPPSLDHAPPHLPQRNTISPDPTPSPTIPHLTTS